MRRFSLVLFGILICDFLVAQSLPKPIEPLGFREIKIKSATASEFRNSATSTKYAPEKCFDNNLNTEYHSDKDSTKFPVYVKFNFDTIRSVRKMDYYPRTDDIDLDGHWKEIQVVIYDLLDSSRIIFDNKGNGFTQFNRAYSPEENFHYTIDFGKKYDSLKSIELIFYSGHEDLVTMAEVDFWEPTESSFDPTTIFTDNLFTKFVPGLTKSDIEAISDNDYFKNYALDLYNNTYQTDFRVQKYSAYPHPGRVGNKLRIYSQSQCSNVTGIYLQKGDEIFVVSDQNAELLQVDFWPHSPDNDTVFDATVNPLEDQQKRYVIKKGLNRIKAEQNGLFYVQYWSDTFETVPPVNMHFMYGRINGYFDGRINTSSEWKQLLNKAQYPYYDLIGKYVQITFPTDGFKELTEDGKDLIDLNDELNYLARKIHGHIDIKGSEIPNHSHVAGIYKKYKYAAPYATYYNVSNPKSIEKNFNAQLLKDDFFGTVHEWGHSLQIRQALNWGNLTETTCNISAYYAWVTKLGYLNSKELNSTGSFPTKYESSWDDFIVRKKSFADELPGKMAMFWQLHLYCSEVLGDTNFYPRLHDMARYSDPSLIEEDAMLNFTYLTAKSSTRNFNAFFQKWGFYRIGTFIAGDYYGKDTFQMTEEIIGKYQQKVDDLKYEKITDAVEYITDNNFQLFKNKSKVIIGTHRINSGFVFPENWKNVVVYESFKNGQLSNVYLNPDSIKLADEGIEQTIYAVQYDGERILFFSNQKLNCSNCLCPELVKINQDALDKYYADPANNHLEIPAGFEDRPWEGSTTQATAKTIEDNFTAARKLDNTVYQENTEFIFPEEFKQLVCKDGSDTCDAKDKVEKWFLLSNQQKGLYLINSERVARGLPPFEGVSTEVAEIAQYYADILGALNNGLDHNLPLEVNGVATKTPWERLNSFASVKGNTDFYGFAENLAYKSNSPNASNIPLEYAVYNWIYKDKSSDWGHRNFNLSILNENSGSKNQEGLLGFGVKRITQTDGSIRFYTVMNAIDPNETFNFESTIVLCDSVAVTLDYTDINDLANLHIYPNPFSDFINFSSKNLLKVQIYDSQGALVVDTYVTNGVLFTNELKSGFYYLNVSQNGNTYRQKMIKID